jgi:hypothetical protein
MNVEIGTEAAQFPEKEYINGIFVAVCSHGRVCLKQVFNISFSDRIFVRCPLPDRFKYFPAQTGVLFRGMFYN